MAAILLSVQPRWCELIASGIKKLEVRKTNPKLETPFKVYIYCTADDDNIKGLLTKSNNTGKIYTTLKKYCQALENAGNKTLNRKVIGEFVCDAIIPISITYSDMNSNISMREFPGTSMTDREIIAYLGNGVKGYCWHISSLLIYDEPLALDLFRKPISCNRGDCFGCRKCKIKKAPNSWCYVDELHNSSDIVRTISTLKGIKKKSERK